MLNFSIGQGENTQTLINMVKFYEGLANDGEASIPYIVRQASTEKRDLGLTQAQLDGLRHAAHRGRGAGHGRGERGGRTWRWPERPAPRRTRMARTTAGSSGLRRPISPS